MAMKTKNYFLTLLLAAIVCVPFTANAQVAIGSGEAPRSFSVLELFSDGERGLRLPQMTIGQRDDMTDTPEFQAQALGAAMGLQIFNTSNRCIETWIGTRWVSVCEGFEVDGLRQRDPSNAIILRHTYHIFGLAPATDNICGGEISYLWEWSTDEGASWDPVLGVVNNLAQLTTPALAVDTWFRRIAFNLCGDHIISSFAQVIVVDGNDGGTTPTLVVAPAVHSRPTTFHGDNIFVSQILPSAFDQCVTWESLHPAIAFMNADGTLTAISPGRATIVATSCVDGSLQGFAHLDIFEPVPLTTPHPAPGWTPNGGTHTFFLVTAQGAGGVGTFTYQWQGSVSNDPFNWTDIPGATGQHFTTAPFVGIEPTYTTGEGGLIAGTFRYFRRVSCSGDNNCVYSNPARVTVFATRNVSLQPGLFVEEPGHIGAFFQWNRNLAHSSANPRINSDGNNTWDTTSAPGTAWYAVNDPCPNGWRVPTRGELILLNTDRLNLDGSTLYAREPSVISAAVALSRGFIGATTNGQIFPRGARGDGTGTPGIFLPAAGWRNTGGALTRQGLDGIYWDSAPSGNTNAWYLIFNASTVSNLNAGNRAHGFSVRCVAE